jgi:hypothetical protein
MAQAKKIKEITLTMPNRVGLLAEVTGAVSGAKANITAICAYAMENRAYFMLTTDNHGKAKKALARLGSEMVEEAVIEVEVPNRPGELEKVAKKIADAGIEIEYMYATARLGKTATCVFKTVDDPKAIKVINK